VDSAHWAVSRTRLRLDLFRLVSSVFASAQFEDSTVLSPPLVELESEFWNMEVEHALVAVAALTRVLFDQTSPRPAEARAECGDLVVDQAKPLQVRRLTVREACNKILHADRRAFETARDLDPSLPGLTGWVQLEGTQLDRQRWRASIDLLAFACELATFTSTAAPSVRQPE
jgi:hypothetical protein